MVPNVIYKSPLVDRLLSENLDDETSDLNTSVFERDNNDDVTDDKNIKNTKGVKEEWIGPRKSVDSTSVSAVSAVAPSTTKGNILTIVFFSMIVVGLVSSSYFSFDFYNHVF